MTNHNTLKDPGDQGALRLSGIREAYNPLGDFEVLGHTDTDLQYIAGVIVAGVDDRLEFAPDYENLVAEHGEDEARRIIHGRATDASSIDAIQAYPFDPESAGLFGGLSEDGSRYEFSSWDFRHTVSMTLDEARRIVNGEPVTLTFHFPGG